VTEKTFTSEAEQYAYDQSLANAENAGMLGSVLVNLFILAIVVGAIVFFARKKSRKQ